MGADQSGDADVLSGLELRQLRYFAAVAEAGTVTAAARSLRIAQPSLSQQIRLLERRIGTPLFRRVPQGMELTEGGQALLAGVNRALEELRASIAASRVAPTTVPVGVCHGVPASALLRAEQILALGPDGQRLRLVYQQADSQQQSDLVRGGTLALGIMRAPAETSGLEVRTLNDEPLGVVLHRRNPLADEPELTWSQLVGQRLLWFPSHRAPGYAAAVLTHVRENGWRPDLVVEDAAGHTLFRHRLTARNALVALRPRGAVSGDADLVWRPVGPNPPRERLILTAAARTSWARLLSGEDAEPVGAVRS
ncbi:LysR family transcriptional regulator [Streptomyces albus subsp. chlorinus]|uniref:LysR family transcriptional regulator n=1 Tax=Streptomyces albus TaxID=1888 RepID=UPI001570C0C2|nr:LysR family transcriptional regulator [Streptomyces albus]NSC19859.1 LysR family transcriptional regulator [Streptomyces albus subsp. chlorinus]